MSNGINGEDGTLSELQRTALGWITITSLTIFLAVIMTGWVYGLWKNLGSDAGSEFLTQRFPALVGLPACGAAALVIVVVFRQTAGPIQIEGLSFKFKGAAGPVILWAICFSVIAAALKFLW
jgi:hypothetical protein